MLEWVGLDVDRRSLESPRWIGLDVDLEGSRPGYRCGRNSSGSQLLGGLWITCQIQAAFPQAVDNLWILHFFACAVIVTLDFCYR